MFIDNPEEVQKEQKEKTLLRGGYRILRGGIHQSTQIERTQSRWQHTTNYSTADSQSHPAIIALPYPLNQTLIWECGSELWVKRFTEL